MKHKKKAKEILDNDAMNLLFIGRKLRGDIEKEIEECLERQQKEIDQVVDELFMAVRLKFNSVAEFKVFIVNNLHVPS